jgi:cell wall-associated NlpC family hydrolase
MLMANPLPGDFACVPIAGGVGRLIRYAQWLDGTGRGDYQHAFIYMGNSQIIEAAPGGARRRDLGIAPRDVRGALWSSGIISLTDKQRDMVCLWAEGYLGTPYSFLDYWALTARRLGFPEEGALQQYIATSRHMICSQYVAQCYYQSGTKLFPGRWTGYDTPMDLANVLIKKRGELNQPPSTPVAPS